MVAHGGMLRAARAILDECGARRAVARLRANGYALTVVGHSLGAGVAVLLTALLNADDAASSAQRVKCFAFACPACASEALTDLLQADVTAVVHQDDVVPRLSDANCEVLAAEIVANDTLYRERFARRRAGAPYESARRNPPR